MEAWEKNLNALVVVILAVVLFGASSVQFLKHEEPCPLCLLQRLGMLGVATGALLNIKFGTRGAHYGLSLLSAIMGGFVALRQIALHICPGFPKYGIPFWGLSLYTWSFIVFVSSVACISLFLLIFDRKEKSKRPQRLNRWCGFAFALIFLIALINILTTFLECGWGPCQCA